MAASNSNQVIISMDRVRLETRETAFNCRIQTFAIKNLLHIDIEAFLNDSFPISTTQIKKIVLEYSIIKVGACFIADFIKNSEQTKLYIFCEYETIDLDIIENEALLAWFQKNIIKKVLKRMEEFEVRGSGWQFDSIVELKIECNQYDVIKGGTYIPLNKFLAAKKAVLNIQNNDNLCFMWSILAHLHNFAKNQLRVEKYYPFKNELNFTGIELPIQPKNIKKFEELNPTISVNVYMLNEEKKKCIRFD